MMKRIGMFILMVAMAFTPVFGSSDNSVDKNLAVKDDYTFEPGKAFVSLRIQEENANEFGNDPVSFTVKLANAKWFKLGDPVTADPEAMESDSTRINLAGIDIVRMSDHELEITLDRSLVSDSEKAWWKIPIYAEVSGAGIVTLEVDGNDGLVTSGVYEIAQAHGGDYLNAGYKFTPENQQWMTIREPQANSFVGTQKFKLVLENGTWFPANDSKMGTEAMMKAAVISGIEAGSISKIQRINDKSIELTIQRGAGSSLKGTGVWSIPLYFTVDKFGLAKVTIDSEGSAVTSGSLGTQRVTDPIRYIRTETLTLNQPSVSVKQGSDKSTVTLDVSPVNPSGWTLIPVRGVFEQFGASIQWNGDTRTVTIVTADKRIILNADSSSATVNGEAAVLAQKPIIVNGRLLIPLRFVSEKLGFGVEWLQATQQIIIRQD